MTNSAFLKQSEKVLEHFCNYMEDKGYSVWAHNDKGLGYGAIASKDDHFVPIISLHIWARPQSYSLHIDDRNGNFVLNGNTAGIYSLDLDEKNVIPSKEIISCFDNMLNDVYKKYGTYSKTNRLDFVFNELEMDRKFYTIPTKIKNSNNDDFNKKI